MWSSSIRKKLAVGRKAFFVVSKERAYRPVPCGKTGVKVTIEKLAADEQGEVSIPLAAAGPTSFGDGGQTGCCHEIGNPPFIFCKRRRSGENTAGDPGAHCSTAGAVESAKPSLYIFSTFAGRCQFFRPLFIAMQRTVRGYQHSRNQEVMLRAMHPDCPVSHQAVGKFQRVSLITGTTGLLDQLDRRQAVAQIADEVAISALCICCVRRIA
jgi:hypothetical protein